MFNALAPRTTTRLVSVRTLTAARAALAPPPPSKHSADSYFKDVDSEPPKDSTVHRVDSASDAVQRPYEPPADRFSQAGVEAAQTGYRTVNEDKPYDSPDDGGEKEKLRYGGVEKYPQDGEKRTSGRGEGPSGESAEGRKPEGRS